MGERRLGSPNSILGQEREDGPHCPLLKLQLQPSPCPRGQAAVCGHGRVVDPHGHPGKWVLPLFQSQRKKLRPRTSHDDRSVDPSGMTSFGTSSRETHPDSVPPLPAYLININACPPSPRGPLPCFHCTPRALCTLLGAGVGWGPGRQRPGACFAPVNM